MARKPDLTEFEALTEASELRATVNRLQAQLRRAKAKNADLVEAVHQAAKDAAVALGNPPKVPRPKKDARRAKPEAALLHCSDWQVGKKTSTYDTGVAEKRLELLGKTVIRLVEIDRADHPVPEIHVLFGGDFLEGGTIFPGQAWEVDSSVFSQVFSAVGCGERLLRHLLANFERVEVWEEPGNHGRLGRKGELPEEDSADLLIYRLIRERLAAYEGEGRLVWHETQGWHSIVRVGSYRALLVHGDEIKQFGGNVPAFGITKKVNAWATGVVEPFTDCYMGHFHQPMVLPIAHGQGRIFVNPSIESDNTYAQEFMGASGTPGQRLNFIEPHKGRVTSEYVIWLDRV